MKTIRVNKSNFLKLIILKSLVLSILLYSCESLVEVEIPTETFMDRTTVFADEATARSAMIGMYSQMREGGHPFNGNRNGLADLSGLAADELQFVGTNIDLTQTLQNEILSDNDAIESLWFGLYSSIYTSNLIIENLVDNKVLSEELTKQYLGESLFVRAFCYFYLINQFGDVPLALSSDYRTNANLGRSSTDEIFKQIKKDLEQAIENLREEYPDSGERIRPNKSVAFAMLARVCLYTSDWECAEMAATEVIMNPFYELVDLNSITLANNKEAIWQLAPGYEAVNPPTPEGENYISNSNSNNILQDNFLTHFEENDARMVSWISTNTSGAYIPYKYQVGAVGSSRQEYTTVLRLGEQYLIRAEARAQLNKLADAITDLDVIRDRAHLSLISETNPGINKENLIEAIIKEKQVELFTEWGHRWLDLKRTGKARDVLIVIKPNITENDLLWPIPQIEINNNPALRGQQNPGY